MRFQPKTHYCPHCGCELVKSNCINGTPRWKCPHAPHADSRKGKQRFHHRNGGHAKRDSLVGHRGSILYALFFEPLGDLLPDCSGLTVDEDEKLAASVLGWMENGQFIDPDCIHDLIVKVKASRSEN